MITDNPDTNSSPSESPSSRPMTLRQQLDEIVDKYCKPIKDGDKYVANILTDEAVDAIEALCQEIAREARSDWTLELPDLPWFQIKAFNEERAEWWSPIYDTTNLPVELTQKPPQPLADVQSGTSPKADSNQVDNHNSGAKK